MDNNCNHSFQSRLIDILVNRICPFPKKMHNLMRRRLNLKHSRLWMARAIFQVPHPIFFKKSVDLLQFEQVWRAMKVCELLHLLEAIQGASKIQVVPANIRMLTSMFNRLYAEKKTFAMRFDGNDGNNGSATFVMKFTLIHKSESESESGGDKMVVDFQMFRSEGYSSPKYSVVLERTNNPHSGIELKWGGENSPLIRFFYTQFLEIRNFQEYLESFRTESVTFYEEPENKRRF